MASTRSASIGFGLERLGRIALRYPLAATLIVLAWTFIACLGILQIEFDDDISDAFRSERPEFVRYSQFVETFGPGTASLYVLFEGDDLVSRPALEGLRDVALEARLVEGIDGALSVFSLRDPPDADGKLRAILPAELPDGSGLTAILGRIADHPVNRGRLLSADRTLATIILQLAPESIGHDNIRRIERDILEIAKDVVPSSVRVTVAGMASLRAEFIEQLIRDQYLLNGLGIAISLLIGTILLRNAKAAILTATPPVIAVLWVLGGMGLTGIKINLMTNVLPVLILVIAFADTMHLTFGLRDSGGYRPDRAVQAACRALLQAGPACVLAGLTAAAAFASLTLSDARLIESFGIAGALAILGAVVAVVVVHPLAVYWLGRAGITVWRPVSESRNDLPLIEGFVGGCARLVIGRPVVVLAAGLAVALTAGLTHWQIWPVYSFMEHIPRDSASYRAMDIVEHRMGGAHNLYIPVSIDGDGFEAGDLQRIGRSHEAIETAVGDHGVLSLWTAARWLDAVAPGETGDELRRLINDLPRSAGGQVMSEDRKTALITVSLPDRGAEKTQIVIDKIEDALRDAGMAEPGSHPVTGFLAVSSTASTQMITRLNYSLMLAVVLSIGVIIAAFRSFRMGIFALIPNLLPIFIAGAALVLLGRGLQFTSAIALTIAFGIAVDDTVHFLSAYTGRRRRGRTRLVSIQRAYRRTGPAMAATTIILCTGLLVTLVSQLPMVHLFGWLTALTLAAAFFADMILLPAILMVVSRLQKETASQ